MGSIVLYILEWAFALIVLLTIYKAAFSGTTFYRFNRFYLLGATVLSALLPLLHITLPEQTPVVSDLAIEQMDFAQELTGTFVFTAEPLPAVTVPAEPAAKSGMWAVVLVCMYSAYVLMLLVGWSRSIIRARRFLRGKHRRRVSRTVWLVTHDEDFGPFSWMNYIVISDTESGFARKASLRHEFAHIRLLHSADLVFLLACTVVNPVCWLVLQEIKIVHEFEADNEVINRYGIRNSDYQKLLIMRTVGAEAYALASSFNLNIKKRIIMLNKNQTRRRRLMWLLLLIPMLGMTSVLFARTEKAVNLDDKLRFTQSNVEMPFRLPEPIMFYNSSGTPASAGTLPPPPAAVTRAEYIRVIGDDEVISDEDRKPDEMIIRQRNAMIIQINKNNEIYVRNGLIKRVITIDELKDLAKRFIQNPDNDTRLPVIEDFEIEGYGTVQTTVKHVLSLQYDRSSSAGVWSDVRYELQKAYNELRDELCMSKFGKNYDQCTDSQQKFARGMYQMKISEAQPRSYDGEGNLIQTQVRSAAANPELAKTNKVNKDLRIRVKGNPAWLYVSTVLFDNENGQDHLKSETTPKQIRVEGLNDYIDQAISDGMRIRKVRLSMQPDVPMGPIIDLKETIRYRMLLNLVMESCKEPAEAVQGGLSNLPAASAGTYDYNEYRIIIQGDIIGGQKLKLHHENGIDECIVATDPRRLQLDGMEDFIDGSDFVNESIQQATIIFWPNSPTETLDEVKTILRRKGIINIKEETPNVNAEDVLKPEMIPDSDEDHIAEIEDGPEFPGGTQALLEYMRTHIRYPADAREQDIQGRVLVVFIVNKDGSIAEPEVVKSVSPSLDEEALRIISTMPKWNPGMQRGKPVRTRYTLPVNFRLASIPQPDKWIGVERLNLLSSEQYSVYRFKEYEELAEPVENMESAVKDLFEGKRKAIAIPNTDENLKKLKEIIAKYPNKKVNWM